MSGYTEQEKQDDAMFSGGIFVSSGSVKSEENISKQCKILC